MISGGDKTGHKDSPRTADARRERLAAELRANLKRRKAQAKARLASFAPDPAVAAPDGKSRDDGGR